MRQPVEIHIPGKVNMILRALQDAGHEAYVVGGCVRDALLEKEPNDWDVTTSALPQEVKAIFHHTVDTGLKHGTVTVLNQGEAIEVTTYRVDGDYEDGRHPKEVSFTRSLSEDLRRRDFTINAMAYNEQNGIVDLWHGQDDLENKVVRAVGDPFQRFSEDALRIMRAVRFSAQLGFEIDSDTFQAAKELAPNLRKISSERVRVELEKMLTSAHPDYLRTAYEMGITRVVLPEWDACMQTPQNNPHHMYSVGEHILHSMTYVRPDKVLRLTMMLHDIAKPIRRTTDEQGVDHFYGHEELGAAMADEILRRLKYDNVTRKQVVTLVKYHDISILEDPAVVRKRIAMIGEDLFPLLLEVKCADMTAQSDYFREEKMSQLASVKEIYGEILKRGECISLKDLDVNGADLIDAGVQKGTDIGRILNLMLADVLKNPSHNNKEYLIRRYC